MAEKQGEAATNISFRHSVHLPLESVLSRFKEGQAIVEDVDHAHVHIVAHACLHELELSFQEVVLDLFRATLDHSN